MTPHLDNELQYGHSVKHLISILLKEGLYQ